MNKHFLKIRWIIMFFGFVIFTFGVYIFGKKISGVDIPVFVCPINREGTIEGACYNLSHLNGFFIDNSFQRITTFFVGVLLFIVLFGRMLCGFLCPFGLIQDIFYKIRGFFKVSSVRFGEKNLPGVKSVKWGFVFIFFGIWIFGLNFCEICPVLTIIPPLAGAMIEIKMSFFVCIIVIVGSFFKIRLWCNVCPLGYFIGLFHRISFFRLKKDCKACTECGACYEACPMEIKSIYTEREKENITTTDCLFCSECIKVCPEDKALSITCLNKKVYVSAREDFFYNNK